MLPLKIKWMFIGTVFITPIQTIGTTTTIAMVFHFFQSGCIQMFMKFRDFSLFRVMKSLKNYPGAL
jgi:hypothetical protein